MPDRSTVVRFLALAVLVVTQSGCALFQALYVGAGYTNTTASLDGDGLGFEPQSRSAFNLGVGTELPFGPVGLAFLPELQYSQEGARFVTDLGGGMTDEGTTSTSYLRVPALFGWSFGSGTGVRPKVYAGPNFGYLLGCTDDYGSESYDCKDDKKSIDVAGTLGGGIDFPLGSSLRGGIDARYSMGLTNILSDDTYGDEKNRNWQARAVVRIPVGNR